MSFFPFPKKERREYSIFYVHSHLTSLFPASSSLRSNEFDVSPVGHDDISLADMYRWKVSAYAPCSSTCTSGR